MNVFDLYYKYTPGTLIGNLGDDIQTLAVRNLYQHLSEPLEIIPLERSCLAQPDQELPPQGILPMQGWFSNAREPLSLPPSSQIQTVFIGFHMQQSQWNKKHVEQHPELISYLKKQSQPVGCREDLTTNYLRSFGVQTYTSLCSTLTFPTREIKDSQTKIYFVDMPINFEDHSPFKDQSQLEFRTHIDVLLPYSQRTQEVGLKRRKKAQKLLEEYRDHAKLVVTTRLHAALPCIAMGIPVIFCHKTPENFRLKAARGIVPIYNLSHHLRQINWNPDPINIDHIKKAIIENFIYQFTYKKELLSGSTETYSRHTIQALNTIGKELENNAKKVTPKSSFLRKAITKASSLLPKP